MRRIVRAMVRLATTVSALALLLAACAGDVNTGALRGTSPEGGYAALLRVADGTRAKGDLATAAGMYRRAAELAPGLPRLARARGSLALARGQVSAARRFLDHAIALDKKFRSLAGTDPDLAPLRDAGWPDNQGAPTG